MTTFHSGACCSSCDAGGSCEVQKSVRLEDLDTEQLGLGVAYETERLGDASKALDAAVKALSADPDAYRHTVPVAPEGLRWKIEKGRKLSRKTKFQGLDISIETDKGEKRHWYDPHNKTEGTTTMKYPYGYILRTMGADDEHVDVFLGPNEDSEDVFIVHQRKAPDFEEYDEDKVMLGFESAREAKAAYKEHYNDPQFFGTMTSTTMDDFKRMFVDVKKSKQGKIPVKRQVTRGGSTFEQTFWINPEDEEWYAKPGEPMWFPAKSVFRQWAEETGFERDHDRDGAIWQYMQDGFRDINKDARAGNITDEVRRLDEEIAETVLPEDVILHRGVRDSKWADVSAGDVIDEPGFLSTSGSEQVAESFATRFEEEGGKRSVLSIEVPAGTPAAWVSNYEEEVLLGRNHTLEVTDVGPYEWDEDLTHVKAKLVPKEESTSKSTSGKVPVKRQVTRGGKTFQQTFWVNPEDVEGEEKHTPFDASAETMQEVRNRMADVLYDQFNIKMRHPNGEVQLFSEEGRDIDGAIASMDRKTGRMKISDELAEKVSSFLDKWTKDPSGTVEAVESDLAAMKAGEHPDKTRVHELAAFRSFVHEMIHNAGPPKVGSHDKRGKSVEEIVTEMSARDFIREEIGIELPFVDPLHDEIGFRDDVVTDYNHLLGPPLEAIVETYDVSLDEAYERLSTGAVRFKRWGGEVEDAKEAILFLADSINGDGDPSKVDELNDKLRAIDWSRTWDDPDWDLTPRLKEARKSFQDSLEQIQFLLKANTEVDLNKGALDKLRGLWTKVKETIGRKPNASKPKKRWVRGTPYKRCATGICARLDGIEVPIDEPFPWVQEKMGMGGDGPPAHDNCNCTVEIVDMGKSLEKASRGESTTKAMAPQPAPQAAQMPPAAGPAMQPEPDDVETFEGVSSLLNRLGKLKDQELIEIARKTWGDGYTYEGMPPMQARAEILGFLLDQRDLLGVRPAAPEPESFAPSPSLPVTDPRGSSEYSGAWPSSATAVDGPSPAETSPEGASMRGPSTASSELDSSSKNDEPRRPPPYGDP